MSNFISYQFGQQIDKDQILKKILLQLNLNEHEVEIKLLNKDVCSGVHNDGVFSVRNKINNEELIVKFESIKGHKEYDTEAIKTNFPNMSDIESFKNSFPEIENILTLPIITEKTDLYYYSVMPKVHGRELYNMKSNHDPKLTRPSFSKFYLDEDLQKLYLYESYENAIYSELERFDALTTTDEIKQLYYKFGQNIGKLHLAGMKNKTSEEKLAFVTDLIHGSLDSGNVIVSPHEMQIIDNADLVLGWHRGNISITALDEISFMLFDIMVDGNAIENITYKSPEMVIEFYTSFINGYSANFENKVACAEFLKNSILKAQNSWSDGYSKFLASEGFDQKFINQLCETVDKLVGESTKGSHEFF